MSSVSFVCLRKNVSRISCIEVRSECCTTSPIDKKPQLVPDPRDFPAAAHLLNTMYISRAGPALRRQVGRHDGAIPPASQSLLAQATGVFACPQPLSHHYREIIDYPLGSGDACELVADTPTIFHAEIYWLAKCLSPNSYSLTRTHLRSA